MAQDAVWHDSSYRAQTAGPFSQKTFQTRPVEPSEVWTTRCPMKAGLKDPATEGWGWKTSRTFTYFYFKGKTSNFDVVLALKT